MDTVPFEGLRAEYCNINHMRTALKIAVVMPVTINGKLAMAIDSKKDDMTKTKLIFVNNYGSDLLGYSERTRSKWPTCRKIGMFLHFESNINLALL